MSWPRWPAPTRRGLSLLVAALVAVFLAHQWSVPVLLQGAGALLVALVLAMVAVAFGRVGWTAHRRVEPAVVGPGDPIEVAIRLHRERRAALEAVEWWEDASGGGHSGLVPSAPSQLSSSRYALRLSQRGRHRVGPTSVRVADPFGLASRWVELAGDSAVIVLPRRIPLSADSVLLDHLSERFDTVDRTIASRGHGEPDVVARPYRFGDAVKRLHWKATAHRGALMVRQDEHHSRRRVALLVDTRADDDRELDWRVSAAASVLECVHRQGTHARLVLDGQRWDVPVDASPREALIALALAAPGTEPVELSEPDAHVLIFAGRVDAATADRWTQMRTSPAPIAFVHAASERGAVEQLRDDGWWCLDYRDRDDLATLWQHGEARPWGR